MFTVRSILAAAITAVGLLSVSASHAAAADAKATGTITVDGQPLAAGKVTFYQEDGQFVGSKVKDGKYRVDHVSPGTYRVTVEGEGVPARFTSDATSPLTVEVKEAANTLDFELK